MPNLQLFDAPAPGLISHTGVGGLTLGGGVGLTSRLLGLTCDALVGARVVTSSGKVLAVNQHHHSDLFWVRSHVALQELSLLLLILTARATCNSMQLQCEHLSFQFTGLAWWGWQLWRLHGISVRSFACRIKCPGRSNDF